MTRPRWVDDGHHSLAVVVRLQLNGDRFSMKLPVIIFRRNVTAISTVFAALCCVALARPALAAQPGTRSPAATEIRITLADRSQLAELTTLVSIEDARGTEVQAVATPDQLERLRAAGYSWQVLPVTMAAPVTMCPQGWEDDSERTFTCYPTYQQYTLLLQGYAAAHPGICRLVDLGVGNNTAAPHHLWAVVVTDNPDLDEDEPEVLLTSSMHGDETTGFILMLRLVGELLAGYGGDPDLTALVNATEIWINPLANPDGAYHGGDSDLSEAVRSYTLPDGTDSGVDPNRNFPDPQTGEHPDGRVWWPETQAMMALAATRSFVLSANFHDGVEVVNYPWDTWARRHPDDEWFQALAHSWADLAQTDSPGGYMVDFDNGITNGFDWYQVHGGRQDFMTYFHGAREVTIELSRTKLQPAENLDNLWQWNRRALLDLLTHAHEGVRGLVTDPDGSPLAATIEVVGHDTVADNSFVRTDPAVGDYHRLLLPGTYDLRFTAPGYVPYEVGGVAVSDGPATVVDAVLHPRPTRRAMRRVRPASVGGATFLRVDTAPPRR